jgi:hypothetical protein
MRPGSDIDVLIVMPEDAHRRRTAQDIHQQLFGFPLSVDVLVAVVACDYLCPPKVGFSSHSRIDQM